METIKRWDQGGNGGPDQLSGYCNNPVRVGCGWLCGGGRGGWEEGVQCKAVRL